MKKIFLVLISMILLSCGARKTQTSISETKKDSTSTLVVTQDTKLTKNTEDTTTVKYNVSEEEICITPVDTSKAIIVNGKSYKNANLTIRKKKDNTLYQSSKKVSEIHSNKVRYDSTTEVKTSEKKKDKATKRDSISWLWLLLLIPIAGVVYYLYRKYKSSPLMG